MNFCQLWLTCEDGAEASKIAKTLLDKKLIVCAKQLPISADYRWKGSVEHGREVLLVMESHEELFDRVETEVAKLHSYETFVLQAVPLVKVSKDAQRWMNENLA